MKFENSEKFARSMVEQDELASFRNEFLFPKSPAGEGKAIYLCGNSLGLQPKKVRSNIEQELEDWEALGVEGHVHARKPWLPYHENVTNGLAHVVGALPSEVVAMNSLSVNVHLLMVSFYRPTQSRYKIVVEAGAFPSDQYAVASQAKFHGFDPKDAILELKPRAGERTLRNEDVLQTIEKNSAEIAVVLLGNVNYLTGQAFDIPAITEAAHRAGAMMGVDLAHGAGNLFLKLHDWNVDFACWCSYKYLNSGPGAIAGAFVHERHGRDRGLPKFAGWWGHNKETRFQMGPTFDPIVGAESWQLSNPPIFQLAALRASLELFERATMPKLRAKSDTLTAYLEFLIDQMPKGKFEIITPRDPKSRGAQLSLRVIQNARGLLTELNAGGVIADFREPDVIRVAPAPLYNSFTDVYRFGKILEKHA
jgi:kynureninase